MPSIPVVGQNGEVQGTLELSSEVFGGAIPTALLHQSVVRELAAKRAGTHDTKGRSEVSGGGRKPWRQKGTGRARQGSIRATQWKGGGKPFGPTPRKYTQRMPAEMRRAALRSALAAKVAAGELTVVEELGVEEPKTKALASRLKGLGMTPGPTLLVVSEVGPALARAARNIPWLRVERPAHVSVYQLLRNGRVIAERAAILAMQEALAR